jgi:hypothetical protein
MLAHWQLAPDAGRRLVFKKGSVLPPEAVMASSGFAQWVRAFSGGWGSPAVGIVGLGTALLLLGLLAWRWAVRQAVPRYSPRFIFAFAGGSLAFVLSAVVLFQLVDQMNLARQEVPRGLTFLAPVQPPNSALQVEVENQPDTPAPSEWRARAWPILPALLLFLVSIVLRRTSPRLEFLCRLAAWAVLIWTALRVPNGGAAGLGVLAAFLLCEVLWPVGRQLWKLPRQTEPVLPLDPSPPVAGAQIVLTLAGLLSFAASVAAEGTNPPVQAPQLTAQMIDQEIRVEDSFAFATAKIRWQAEPGQILPLLYEPAILTRLAYPSNATRLVSGALNGKRLHQIIAIKKGIFELEMNYELRVAKRDQETGFQLPLGASLVNRAKVTIVNQDVDLFSPAAASIQRETSGSNTISRVVLAPRDETWISWKPRTRDLKNEKTTFYADLAQLYVPAAGVIEGVHLVSIRPAQGELAELLLDVPPGWTITEISETSTTNVQALANVSSQFAVSARIALWRFDPDTRKLRVRLDSAQSRPFAFLVRSQLPTGSLPSTNAISLLSVDGASGQIGVLGIATGAEVQLDVAVEQGCSSINLEDFPVAPLAALQGQIPGLGLRRAFRYAELGATVRVQASAVEPDVRVETQDTLSLAEDRVVLAVAATVDITRAGIFKLSFTLPPGMDVESISGDSLSHWTELKSGSERVITLNLKGRTEGRKTFTLSLAGSGVKASRGWPAPQVTFREAAKMRGTLLIVPEQGLRLQTVASEGLAQLDPQKSGVKQKGVLAFRVLQMQRRLTLDLEQVDPWVQVNSLQQVQVNEGNLLISANIQYQIENTGVKTFFVRLPDNAENVRFQNELVTDFLRGDVSTNGLRTWEIRLQRRVLGTFLLQALYQVPVKENATEVTLRGLQTVDAGLQRGFVTVQSQGRLQVRVESLPASLQAAEWQSFPRTLQQGLKAPAATFAFRLVDPAFELPLRLERHEPAKLLEARVTEITFSTAISDDGAMLTQARLEMIPGDKRLLHVSLPPEARFWFAFVNGAGIWPWREQDRYLIPLEKPAGNAKTIVVELFYSLKASTQKSRSLDLDLAAPKFDLPLENITWRVSLNDKWRVQKWTGALQLQTEESTPIGALTDLQNYLQTETAQQVERTRQAEALLAAGNSALLEGDPQQARRSFQAAFGLSTHDAAFNEDARVQLHNVKLQQALVGLNVRQSGTAPDASPVAAKLRDLRGRQIANYTQQDAKEILERNSADDNAALTRLAERLVQQQDAALANPAALRANIPVQGRVLTFKRAVLVDPNADLGLKVRAIASRSSMFRSGLLLGGIVLGMGLLLCAKGSVLKVESEH